MSSAARRRRRLPKLVRWLHIYVSMSAFAATFLFAATGLTLNHAAWFESADPVSHRVSSTLPAQLLADPIDKLDVAERLRGAHDLRGTVSEFAIEDDVCLITWKGPGYSADAVVQRDSGEYEIEEQRRGFVAVIDDLHKGRDCGPAWSALIDVVSVVLAAVAITGFWLLLYLHKWRRSGVLVAVACALGLAAVFGFGVS